MQLHVLNAFSARPVCCTEGEQPAVPLNPAKTAKAAERKAARPKASIRLTDRDFPPFHQLDPRSCPRGLTPAAYDLFKEDEKKYALLSEEEKTMYFITALSSRFDQ
ncbi:hypothetical protein WJX72_007341 [[Myrmecia] bisecta]|uniref:Uncharacterized protein n=1 Tax=[Myrmecia] bisecta TaxID=41462 RepID=A0AAW1QC50_9CHLO